MSLMDQYELEIIEGGGDIVAVETATHLEVIEQEPAVTILELVPDTLEIVVEGPQGPPGPAGGAPTIYEFTAAATWIVTHNKGYFPEVTVLTEADAVQFPDVIHTSLNVTTIIHAVPASGSVIIR